MSAFVLRAKYDGDKCIEIEHEKFQPGLGWVTKTDFVYTEPLGDWHEIRFSPTEDVAYTDFLLTMTRKNVEVWRKAVMLTLHEYQDEDVSLKNIAVNALGILDTTFQPPVFNLNCRWQCELLDHMVTSVSTHVISTCYNKRRLKKYFFEMQEQLRR